MYIMSVSKNTLMTLFLIVRVHCLPYSSSSGPFTPLDLY